ncbi:MAG: D-aminoacyl-tRNA deacylase [Myxococcota bacterium]
MRAVIQRVSSASVEVEGRAVGEIGPGLLVYLGAGVGDADRDAEYVADKIAGLRVFEDDAGKMNRSVGDVDGAVLVVSQFTLFGDMRKGRRPSFNAAAPPEEGRRLYERVVDRLRAKGLRVDTGRFGAMMDVRATVAGPVTILLDSTKRF